MIWTYPCSVDDKCFHDGAIKCTGYDRGLKNVQLGLQMYRALCEKALACTPSMQQDWAEINRLEDFFVRLYSPDEGRRIVRDRLRTGILLGLEVENVDTPLTQRIKSRIEGNASEPLVYALHPFLILLDATLKNVWYASPKPTEIDKIDKRYKNVIAQPINLRDSNKRTKSVSRP